MSLPSWNTLENNVKEIQRLQGRECAREYLMAENNKHGPGRCKGAIVTVNNGDVVMSRCNRWECWRCADGRNGRLWQESQRVMLGTQFMQWIDDIVYTIQVSFDVVPDVSEHEQQEQLAASLSSFIDKWQRKSKVDGRQLLYILGHGIKQTTGVIHVHVDCNYIPDGIDTPTPSHPQLMSSKWLSKRAKNNNLSLWIERARDIKKVGGYIGKNLKETINADIVPHFKRVKSSQDMPRIRRKADISALTKAWLRDYGRGKIVANFGNLEPIWIPHGLIDDAIYYGATVQSSTQPITSKKEVAQKSLSYIHTRTSRFDFCPIIPTVQCSGCRKQYPRTSAYFQESKKNSDGLTNTCIHCIQKDRDRDTKLSRKIGIKARDADNNAICGNRLPRTPLLEQWQDDTCECLYCEKLIYADDRWELEHIDGIRTHGGLNIIENVGFVHRDCHQLKTASGLDGRNYGATIGISVRGYVGTMQLELL
jgi:hypothetical protein